METIPIDVKMKIEGVLYDQVVTTDINVGDRVFDIKDNTHGICDYRSGDHIAIKDGCVSELYVPISRVRKLIPTPLN